MNKRQFLKLLKKKGYAKTVKNITGYFEKPHSNILINVHDNSYDRIILFDNGSLGLAENNVPFDSRKYI